MSAGLTIYSADRFNYVSQRRADLTTHTWREDHDELLRSPVTRPWCAGIPWSDLDV